MKSWVPTLAPGDPGPVDLNYLGTGTNYQYNGWPNGCFSKGEEGATVWPTIVLRIVACHEKSILKHIVDLVSRFSARTDFACGVYNDNTWNPEYPLSIIVAGGRDFAGNNIYSVELLPLTDAGTESLIMIGRTVV